MFQKVKYAGGGSFVQRKPLESNGLGYRMSREEGGERDWAGVSARFDRARAHPRCSEPWIERINGALGT
jgi:hypothetical protein